MDVGVVEGQLRVVRPGTGGDQDHPRPQGSFVAIVAVDDHRAPRAEARLPVHEVDAVALEVLAHGRRHRRDHVGHVCPQPVHRQLGRQAQADPEHIAT